MTTMGLPEHFGADLIAFTVFGVVLILLVGFGVRFIDRMLWKRVDLEEQVQKGNVSAGIVMGSLIIALSLSMALVGKGILG